MDPGRRLVHVCHVGSDDGRHDGAVRVAYAAPVCGDASGTRSTGPLAADPGLWPRIYRGLDGLQRGCHDCPVRIEPCRAAVACDGVLEQPAERRSSTGCRGLSTYAVEDEMPYALPEPAGVPDDQLARWNDGCFPNGNPARTVLPRLLLGDHVPAFRCGRDEPRMDRDHHGLRAGGKGWTCGRGCRTPRRSSDVSPGDR